MSLQLAADGATATLLPERGGLLSSLKLLSPRSGNARELLWLPSEFSLAESGWPAGGAPLLFPFAGRVFHDGRPFLYALPNETAAANGGVRSMPLHGFAYAMPWQYEQQDQTSATLTLAASASSRLLFPFEFFLTARYQLSAQRLILDISVAHLAGATGVGATRAAVDSAPATCLPSGDMPVALGLHPFLTIAGEPATPRLSSTAAEEIQVLVSGAAGKASPRLPERNGPIDQPGLNNLILARHAAPRVDLELPSRGESLRIGWSPAECCRYVVLWSGDTATHFCVEPWMGLPDAVASGAGTAWLPPGGVYKLSFAIELGML